MVSCCDCDVKEKYLMLAARKEAMQKISAGRRYLKFFMVINSYQLNASYFQRRKALVGLK